MKELNLSLFPNDQYRMQQLQVYNWGTFSGLHCIPIARKGFLFVGPSGSGKSTLLDAFSALLVPPRWVDFNAAAREAERSGRDRSFITYVRGAWGEQKDEQSGVIGMRFLRPETTWSALALTYQNDSGKLVTLVQLFWVRGKSVTSTDVRRYYLIFERKFDLNELKDFDLDVRKLKASFPDAFIRDDFHSYCERFRRILGIDSEMALRLLHKTQSAKNLGDLNEFLRHFMLDKPETFEVANRMVTEFGELSAAHQTVVTTREQINTLKPASENYIVWDRDRQLLVDLNTLSKMVEPFSISEKVKLLEERLLVNQARVTGLRGEVDSAKQLHTAQQDQLERLREQQRLSGGEQIARWETEKTKLEALRSETKDKWAKVNSACIALGWSTPSSASEYSETLVMAMKESEEWNLSSDLDEQKAADLNREKSEVEREFKAAVEEVRALESQASNIDSKMLRLREQIARDLGVHESTFPFVGELIEVKEAEASWRGAIERALRGFALSLLVDEREYSSFSNYVNSNFLGQKLVYYKTSRESPISEKALHSKSLVHKLRLKDGTHEGWLAAEIRKRFDYLCADSLMEFRNSEYAITREGQMRLGRSRHEKDDAFRIDDKRRWVLGFSNAEKLALYRQEAHDLSVRIENLRMELEHLRTKRNEQKTRFAHCQVLVNTKWSEADFETLELQISNLEKSLSNARSKNKTLQRLEGQIATQVSEVEKAHKLLVQASADLNAVATEIETDTAALRRQKSKAGIASIPDLQQEELKKRLYELEAAPTVEQIDELARKISEAISSESNSLSRRLGQLEKEIEKSFLSFKQKWISDAADLDTTMESASDFFAKLRRLEQDGLPEHEERFFELLRTQSHENLAALATYMNHTRKEIATRLDLVNGGLKDAPFNPGTYLFIQSMDRQLPEVQEFKQSVQTALTKAWSDEDRESAEMRFLVLKKLVERLASENAPDKRWRELVLDVRLHVEFIGRELDLNGLEVQSYRSGSGISGGQRQKLATTCLAAALRYQLGGYERGAPSYAAVILDEAFDKADNEFTALAMNIFSSFGFQMIVATPLKSVMTLEPFIGGACIVAIKDRRQSGVLLVESVNELLQSQKTHAEESEP